MNPVKPAPKWGGSQTRCHKAPPVAPHVSITMLTIYEFGTKVPVILGDGQWSLEDGSPQCEAAFVQGMPFPVSNSCNWFGCHGFYIPISHLASDMADTYNQAN